MDKTTLSIGWLDKLNKKIDICGVGINNLNLEQAVMLAMQLINENAPKVVFTPNAAILLQCLKDDKFKQIVNTADLCIPDGEGVMYAAYKQNKALNGKVAGVDFAFALLEKLDKACGRLFIYGGTLKSLKSALIRIKIDYPNIRVDGIDGYTYSETEAVTKINAHSADIVFVCLGSPKQELFIANNKSSFDKGLFIGLGGTVDIISKKAKRAPKWVIDCHIEWLWRSIANPKRIFKLIQILEFKIELSRYLKSERIL